MIVFDMVVVLFAIELPKDLSPVLSGIILAVLGGVAIFGTFVIARYWFCKIKSRKK